MYILELSHELDVSITTLYIIDDTQVTNGSRRHRHQLSGNLISREQAKVQSIKTPLQLLKSSPICIHLGRFNNDHIQILKNRLYNSTITNIKPIQSPSKLKQPNQDKIQFKQKTINLQNSVGFHSRRISIHLQNHAHKNSANKTASLLI